MDRTKDLNTSYSCFHLVIITLCLTLSSCSAANKWSALERPAEQIEKRKGSGDKDNGRHSSDPLPAKTGPDYFPGHGKPLDEPPSYYTIRPANRDNIKEAENDRDLPPTPGEAEETDKYADQDRHSGKEDTDLSAEATDEVETKVKITYDFPITVNPQVEKFLDLFQNRHKRTFKKWLERSGRYLPLIQSKLEEAELPLDLTYLPLIESGYNTAAYSRSHAAGPWQFIESTARHYGLRVNSYIDERRDPLRSTEAAIAYLSDLYEEFGDWQLAVAAYNGGGYKVKKGLRLHGSTNFWELAEKNYLYNETENYVPKLIAAILIAKDPAKYGFNSLNYESPMSHDTLEVGPWTSLHKVAVACDADFKVLKELNPALKRQIAPPGYESCTINIPAGKKELAVRNLPKVHAIFHNRYKTHIAGENETLTQICRRYNINKTTLLKANNLTSGSLKKGQRLRIPYQTTTYALLDTPLSLEMAAEDGYILHRIGPGETLSHISMKYQVPAHQIAAWNGLKSIHDIRAGDKLALYITGNNPAVPHFVRRESRDRLSIASRQHMVRKGDSLWEISRRYDISVDRIKALNNLQGNLIHPDTRLILE